MKKVFGLGIFLGLLFMVTAYCNADLIMVESAIHHLGDDYWTDPIAAPYSEWSVPEGICWSSAPFDLPALSSGTVTILFDAVDFEQSSVIVNGYSLGMLPYDLWIGDGWQNNLSVTVDSNLLSLSGNIISFDCHLFPGEPNHDDFLFRNLSIVVPEPATMLLLTLGGLVLRRFGR